MGITLPASKPTPMLLLDGGAATLNVNKGANSFNMMMGTLTMGGADAPDIPTVSVSTSEPGSLILLGTGMMGLAATVRRKLRI